MRCPPAQKNLGPLDQETKLIPAAEDRTPSNNHTWDYKDPNASNRMPTPRTSSECVKVRLEDQERQRAREQDQTVSLLDEYWGIPDPQYPSCFSEQKLYTMARREENRDPFLASTSGVSTLSDVSEKKGSRQLMVLGKFCWVFNSQSPSILFWSTLMLLLTSMTMMKMS